MRLRYTERMDFLGLSLVVGLNVITAGITFYILLRTRRFAPYSLAICLVTLALVGLGFMHSETSKVRTASSQFINGVSQTDICAGAPVSDTYCYETIHTRGYPFQSIEIKASTNDAWKVGLYGEGGGSRYNYVTSTLYNYLIMLAVVLGIFFVIDSLRHKDMAARKRK